MKKFIVNSKLRHNGTLYAIGASIELTEDEAAPLLKDKVIAQGVKGIATSPNENNALKKAFEEGVKEGIEKASGQITDQVIEQIAMDDECFDRVLALRKQIDKDADLTAPDLEQINTPVATPAVEPVAETPAETAEAAPVEPTETSKTTVKKGKR